MDEYKAKVCATIERIIPKMSERERARFLGYVEGLGATLDSGSTEILPAANQWPA